MNEYLKKVFTQIQDFFVSLSPGRKIAVVVMTIGLLLGMAFIFKWAGTQTYQPLMTNLNPEDSAKVIRVLREKKIPFQVDPSGKNVDIPPEYVHDLRFELATMGMPESSTVGYELFDKESLGTTSYVQKVNFKRALEGELTRTISSLKGVKRARVLLALPKKTTFVEDSKPPTASVVVDLDPGVTLTEKQVFGIGNLVASAVEGMNVADVAIVEASGRVLSKTSRDPMVAQTADQLDFQRKIEEDFEKRVVSMLEPVVGDGKVVARVTADIDFSQVNQTQTLYDGDSAAVRSTSKDTSEASGNRPSPGAVGAKSNTPGQDPAQATPMVSNNTNRNNEITNYAIPQTVIQTKKPSWQVSKLSVAVVLDGKETKVTNEKGELEKKILAWSPEQLAEFEKVVVGAVGINKKRGDNLEVKNMEFTSRNLDDAEKLLADAERRQFTRNLITYCLMGIVIVLFFLFVVRPFIKWITENTIDSVDSFLPQTIEELESLQKNSKLPNVEEIMPELPDRIDPEKVEGEMIKEKIVTLVDANPHKAALILREWVRAPKKDDVKDAEEAKAG